MLFTYTLKYEHTENKGRILLKNFALLGEMPPLLLISNKLMQLLKSSKEKPMTFVNF